MDKIAIISDIHGNIPALEAVLQDIENRGISRIICLGDMAGKGPNSDVAVDIIKEKCEKVVKGNWDYLIAEVCNNDFLIWYNQQLGQERVDYLKSLPTYVEFYLSGRLLRLCHADTENVFHRVQASATKEEKLTLFKATKDNELEADIVGYGDIHDAYAESFNNKTIFNVGSVGNPLDIPQASYGIIEGVYEGREPASFSINLVRVPYDIEKAIEDTKNSGMPFLQEYINELITAEYRGKVSEKNNS